MRYTPFKERCRNGHIRAHALMLKAGFVNGHPLWTRQEEQLIWKHHPDYKKLEKMLPRRTPGAIRSKAQQILPNLKHGHVWRHVDVSKLRRIYHCTPKQELLAAFNYRLSYSTLRHKAHSMRLRKSYPPHKKVGNILLDSLRAKCWEIGYTMKDLDIVAKTGQHFTIAKGFQALRRYDKIIKAIRALDGRVLSSGQVEWR